MDNLKIHILSTAQHEELEQSADRVITLLCDNKIEYIYDYEDVGYTIDHTWIAADDIDELIRISVILGANMILFGPEHDFYPRHACNNSDYIEIIVRFPVSFTL